MKTNIEFMDIIILALVAVFLVYRLYGILGKKRGGGESERPALVAGDDEAPTIVEKPVEEPKRVYDLNEFKEPPRTMAEAFDRIRLMDEKFTPSVFTRWAKETFGKIVGAFASGDLNTLRSLLESKVFDNFEKAINQRKEAGETLETNIVRLVDADFRSIRFNGNIAVITLEIISDQIRKLKDMTGNLVGEQTPGSTRITDIWTFTRDLSVPGSTWKLSATDAAGY